MSLQMLTTKLYIPSTRSELVSRPHLIERLNQGLRSRLTLVCAPAGFGKTTIISEWLSQCDRSTAWLSLDDHDNDPTRFLMYVIAALQTISSGIGDDLVNTLQSPQPPTIDTLLVPLINTLATMSENFILVLDDYHVLDAPEIDSAVAFLLDNLPSQMHIVITTREDPQLPLAKYRARAELTELRADDLRFTNIEMHTFLNQVMGLDLTADNIASLEKRTEGWIASLQMVAISLQRHADKAQFFETFTGSHRYILDYLLEEVLHQQSEETRRFLLQTSILAHFNADLCDAVTQTNDSQLLLEQLEQRNLFIIPLDNTRQWYRYHHLFADLLRQQLLRDSTVFSKEDINELHTKASIWYEANGLELEAFQHATVIDDIERAERLIESRNTPLYLRGIVKPILQWLESLPQQTLDAHPSLWVVYAYTLLLTGQHTSVEQKLTYAESALQDAELDATTQDILGRIASMRATLAVIQNDVEAIISQSRYALEHLNPENLSIRIATQWTLGYAYQLQDNHRLARNAYEEVLRLSERDEKSFYAIVATISLGQIYELENQLHPSNEYYQSAIKLSGEPPHQIASEAFLGLARINYHWNDLEAAQTYGQQCHNLLQQMENTDTTASYKVFLAYMHLSRRDFTGASDVLDEAESFVRQNNFMFRMPDIVEAQVRVLIHRNNLTTALQLAETHDLAISQARVYLAQKNASMALQILDPFIQKAKESGLQNELLKGLVLQAVVNNALNQQDVALEVLDEARALASRGGFIRIFVDEGSSMAQLLQMAYSRELHHDYVHQLLSAFSNSITEQSARQQITEPESQWIDPLSQREIEVLQLIANGMTNQEIADQLYLSLHTVKVHARNIYSKLAVKNRTQAVAKGKALGILAAD